MVMVTVGEADAVVVEVTVRVAGTEFVAETVNDVVMVGRAGVAD